MELKIKSFDTHILEDQLLAIMKCSPQTQQYVSLRVKEIIVDLVATPIIKIQEQKLLEQIYQTEQLEKENKQNYQIHQKQTQQYKARIRKILSFNKQLQKYVQQYEQIQLQLSKTKEEIVTILKKNQKLQTDNQQILNQKQDLLIFIEQIKQSLRNSTEHTIQCEELLMKKNKQIEHLQQQVEKVKSSNKATKYNQIQIRKQYQALRKKYEKNVAEHELIKQNLRNQINGRENQRKAINIKLKQLNKQHYSLKEAKKKIVQMSKSVQKIKHQNQIFKEYMKFMVSDEQKRIKQMFQETIDEIGEKLGKQIKYLILQVNSMRTQLRIYKQQLQIKQQIIAEIEKAASKQIQGNAQLRLQLKVKKSEAETLKKELKKNFQEQQLKLQSLEKSYRDILSENNSFIRT